MHRRIHLEVVGQQRSRIHSEVVPAVQLQHQVLLEEVVLAQQLLPLHLAVWIPTLVQLLSGVVGAPQRSRIHLVVVVVLQRHKPHSEGLHQVQHLPHLGEAMHPQGLHHHHLEAPHQVWQQIPLVLRRHHRHSVLPPTQLLLRHRHSVVTRLLQDHHLLMVTRLLQDHRHSVETQLLQDHRHSVETQLLQDHRLLEALLDMDPEKERRRRRLASFLHKATAGTVPIVGFHMKPDLTRHKTRNREEVVVVLLEEIKGIIRLVLVVGTVGAVRLGGLVGEGPSLII